jgi:branched-chain amino acid transport system permease protein
MSQEEHTSEGRDVARLKHVDVNFGGLKALKDVSLTIRGSQVTGIVGPNGAGKTTLLNVMSGLIPPSSGSAEVLGLPIERRCAPMIARAGVSRSFQLLDHFSRVNVGEYMAMGLDVGARRKDGSRWRGSPDAGRRRAVQIQEGLERFGLRGDIVSKQMSEIPYGSRKRIDLARAFVSAPQIVLMDEPTSGLTEPEWLDLLAQLRISTHGSSQTVVVVDHSVGFVSAFCSMLVVLSAGELLEQGEVDTVLKSPQVLRSFFGQDVA